MNSFGLSSLAAPFLTPADVLAAIDDRYEDDHAPLERAEFLFKNGELPEEVEMWENAHLPSVGGLGALIAARLRQKYQVNRPEARYWARTEKKDDAPNTWRP